MAYRQRRRQIMLVYEMKLQGTYCQYRSLDEAIRTGRFVRNSVIRAWLDGQVKSRNDAYKHCKLLSDNPEFPWATRLNSMARQAHAERAWASIERFYRNCKQKIPGSKRCDPADVPSALRNAHQEKDFQSLKSIKLEHLLSTRHRAVNFQKTDVI